MTKALFLIATFMVFILMRYVLGRHFQRRREPADDDLLCTMALRQGCSVYDIFMKAGKEWNYGDARIDKDFGIYLKTADIPLYVRQLLRNLPTSGQIDRRQPSNPPFA